MRETPRVGHGLLAQLGRLLALLLVCAGAAAADPPVVDSDSILESLKPAGAPVTRGLVIEAKHNEGGGGAPHHVSLNIGFASDSDRLTAAAHAQLDELGTALSSPQLAHTRFQIAGHTSASGAPEHNRRLSEARARAVRGYILERFKIAPERIEAVGYGASRPLPEYAPNALQQRRVEISTLPGS